MPTSADAGALLDALDEPAFLVDNAGVIRSANRAARRQLVADGCSFIGRSLADCAADPPVRTEELLQRCRRSGEPVIGTLRMMEADRTVRQYRSRGCRVVTSAGAGVLLRLEAVEQDRFRALTEKVIALNAEIAKNKRVQLLLRNALAEKELLLKELNHRVRNNLQTLLGMLSVAEQRAPDARASEPLRSARMRVEAMAVAQRLLYRSEDFESVDGYAFLQELCASVGRSLARPEIVIEAVPSAVHLSLNLASALGLILNELLTNALKHAFVQRSAGRIRVELAVDGEDRVQLIVEDDGQGMGGPPPSGSGIGLALVQGLARRLGGSCEIASDGGTRCVVTVIDRGLPGPSARPAEEERLAHGAP